MTLRAQRIFWFVFACLALAATAAWAYSVAQRSIDDQRNIVPVSTMWGMHACVIAILAGLGGIAQPIYRLLGRRRMLTAAALLVVGFFACDLAPRTNRILFDEHLYMQIGQTIAHTGRAEGANYARAEYGQFEMYAAWTNKQPNGLPYLLSWIYRVVGVSENASHALNPALTGLTAAALYLGLSLAPWALPAGAALATALLFIFTPLVLWWGHTVAVEPSAAATVALAFMAACAHARLRDRDTAQGLPATGLLLAGTAAFAVYFRPESMLVFPLVAAVLWSTEDRFIEDLAAWGAGALSIALALPNLMHLWSMRTEDWGANDGRRFATEFISKNFRSNGGYFFDSTWFPLAGTAFILIAALWLLVKNRAALLTIGLWFLLSWGIFVMFYAGGYHYGASSRYAVVSCAPVAIFMGIGAAALYAKLRRWPLALSGVLACGLVNWVAAAHYVPTLSREASEAQADVAFVGRMAPTLPEGSLVISPDPCVWLLKGVNSTQFFTIESMVRGNLRDLLNQYPGGIYLHWSFWHTAEPAMAQQAAQLLAEVAATPITRMTSQAFKIGLYRIDTPEGLARFGGKEPEVNPRDSDIDKLYARFRAQVPPLPAPTAPSAAPAAPSK
jgi:hypothetical protein